MKLIILDRDGVINQDRDDYVKSSLEWVEIPKSADAIAFLNQMGYTIAVATNQSGLKRGLFSIHDLNLMHEKMLQTVQNVGGVISGIWFCPNLPDDDCNCRKPKPGMIVDILERFHAVAEETYLVVDSLRDLQTIAEVGGIPVLVLTGKGKNTLEKHQELLPANTQIFDSLWDFSQSIDIKT